MAISLLVLILSAILAPASSSPLIQGQVLPQGDDTLSSNQAKPIIADLPPSATASAPAEFKYGSHRLRSPQPSQTAPVPIHARLDLGPVAAPTPSLDLDLAPDQGCTTTLSEKAVNPCFWDGTKTIYPFITTLYRSVDCHGCSSLDVTKEWYHCPNMRIDGTKVVSTPTTYWSTRCQASTAGTLVKRLDVPATPAAAVEARITNQPELGEAEAKARRGRGPQVDNAACPTTFVVQPEKSAGRTLTVYSRYATTTVLLNCGGCPLVISTALAGYGPANGFTKTTTLPVGTSTTYACY